MWHAMFVQQIPLTEKALRTVIVHALIVVLFRLTGKRGLASALARTRGQRHAVTRDLLAPRLAGPDASR